MKWRGIDSSASKSVPHALRAFRYAAFRRFYAGQSVSIVGSWVQSIALSWLVYRLSGSTSLLGLTAFLTQAPILLLGPLAGGFIDRHDRKRVLLISQWALAAQATLLGVTVSLGVLQVTWLLIMAAVQGFIAAVETPARQSFLNVLVPERADLPNAIALNSFLMNSGRFVGPAIAGTLLVHVQEGVAFLINAFSFLAAIAAIASVPWRHEAGLAGGGTRQFQAFGAGISYALSHRVPRTLLPIVAVVSFFASPYVALMPALVRESFDNSSETLGYLVGAAGLGGLVGTATLAAWRDMKSLPRLTASACGTAGSSLLAFSFSEQYWLSLLCMPFIGFGIIVTAASVNVMLQTTTPEPIRARVIGLYLASFLGMAPFGALSAGLLAEITSVRVVLSLGGGTCMAASLAFAAWTWRASFDIPRGDARPM
ncbi:MAG: MFS transporter [Betaproteobacteria bacterium]|nr:MFS transporter [Betaproteobacteria bacterium]